MKHDMFRRLAEISNDQLGAVTAFASGPSAAALHDFDGYRLKPPFT